MVTVGQLKEMLKDIPDNFPVYISGCNSAGDYVSGDVVSVVKSIENDIVLSNEEWAYEDGATLLV